MNLESKALDNESLSGCTSQNSVDPGTLDQWHSVFSTMSADLLELSQSTEKEFLFLGDRLNHINSVNSENSILAKEVVKKLNKGKAADLDLLKELLNNGFEKADNAESSLSELSSELKKMIVGIEGIVSLNDSLDRTYRTLRMLRVMIRMETENAGFRDFHTVAESLTTLEALITKNANEIQDTTHESIQLIRLILTRFEMDEKNRQLPLKQEQKKILNLISEISGDISNNIETCRQMGEMTGEISKEIFEVVTNLQFHDNYRQRLEHISQNLLEIKSKIPESDRDPDRDLSILKRWGITVINLQAAQLENLKTENHDVSDKLSGSFSRILELLQNQLDMTDRIVPTMTALDQRVKELEGMLNTFCTHLDTYKQANNELVGTAEQLRHQVGGITRMSSLIETNELNLRLLAMNSMIKASRCGRRGKPLAVLSAEINSVSRTVQQQISERMGIIDAIHNGSVYISSTLLENLKSCMKTADETFDQTGASIHVLMAKDDNASNCSRVSQQLKTDFSDLVDKLQFSRIINKGLDRVIENLVQTCDNFQKCLPEAPEGAEASDFDLQELQKKYTMQSERDIHQASISGSPRIDNFIMTDGFDDFNSQSDQKSPDDELGDNIELF
ncbi:hypothetical protein KJ966_29010 [bacterium]|nr:hypothetical protein [bacterium]